MVAGLARQRKQDRRTKRKRCKTNAEAAREHAREHAHQNGDGKIGGSGLIGGVWGRDDFSAPRLLYLRATNSVLHPMRTL